MNISEDYNRGVIKRKGIAMKTINNHNIQGDIFDPDLPTREQLRAMGEWNGSIQRCDQCGKSLARDMLSLFTDRKVCFKCVSKNHRGATK